MGCPKSLEVALILNFVYFVSIVLLAVFDFWGLYNIPIVAAGVRNLLARRNNRSELTAVERELPLVSVIVPAKNEERVIARLLKALLNLNYPSSRLEIIVVNDQSSDRTGEICGDFVSLYPARVRILERSKSFTKAAALTFGAVHSRGEIIATFDADSVPEPEAILKAVKYFNDPAVAGVQGRICSVNSTENMLTRFLSLESAIQYEAYLRGKDSFGLFVGLAGTCQFFRRSALDEVGCWNERSLSEDTELSVRLIEKDHIVRCASEVRTWEESPSNVKNLFRQRVRWYRGNIEMLVKFGRLLKGKPSLRRFDAEMQLFGTVMLLLCMVNYAVAAWAFYLPPDLILTWILRLTSFFILALLAIAGSALVFLTKPLKLSNLLWLPFIYAYWGFQSFIASYAILLIVFRRPIKWSKTTHSGADSTNRLKTI